MLFSKTLARPGKRFDMLHGIVFTAVLALLSSSAVSACGSEEVLAVDGARPTEEASAKETTSSPPQKIAISAEDAVRRIDDTHFEIRRDLWKELSLTSSLQGARLAPAMESGEQIGLKLYQIPRGSLFELLGFQDGDTVRAINNMKTASPEDMVPVYSALKEAGEVAVVLTREGTETTLHYRVLKMGRSDQIR